MASIGFIVALVFASVFGLILIWLILYYTHRHIHQQCLKLDHWFHLISPRTTPAVCCDLEKYLDCETCMRYRLELARPEKARGRSGNESFQKTHRSRLNLGYGINDVNVEWHAQPKVARSRRMLAPVQDQWYGQPACQQIPWQEQIPTTAPGTHKKPAPYSQMLPRGAKPFLVPRYVTRAAFVPQVATMPAPANNQDHRQNQPSSDVRSDSTRVRYPQRHQDNVTTRRKCEDGIRKVDYFGCEVPSDVLNGLKKSAISSSARSSSTSSGSSEVSGTTQELPRRAAASKPSQFSRDAHVSLPMRAPTSYPRERRAEDARREDQKFRAARYVPYEPVMSLTEWREGTFPRLKALSSTE